MLAEFQFPKQALMGKGRQIVNAFYSTIQKFGTFGLFLSKHDRIGRRIQPWIKCRLDYSCY